jgi:hypothetical protein
MPTLKIQHPEKVHESSNGYPFKATLPNRYNHRNLTQSQIRELERREYWRLENLPYDKRETIKYNRAKHQAEKEESLAKLRVYNEEQISNEQAKRRMDMEYKAALEQRDESRRKQREEKIYEALMKGNTRRNINPKMFKAFADKKRKKGTQKKISHERFRVITENRNKSMFPQFPVPTEESHDHMEESHDPMEEFHDHMELAEDEEKNKGGSISKSKTAKKRKNKRKTMRR